MQIGVIVVDFVIYVCEYCLLWVPNFKSAIFCYICVCLVFGNFELAAFSLIVLVFFWYASILENL